jgi:exodeoxyribonuclease III
MRMVSWNVNGLRAVTSRNDLAWAFSGDSAADVVCLQETKIQEDAITAEMRRPSGYRSWFTVGEKKGYSGTAIYVRENIDAKPFTFSMADNEGRICAVDLGAIVVINVYFPNGNSRLAFKHAWHEEFLTHLVTLQATRNVVVCGDFNVAHKAIDLAFSEKWSTVSGHLPEERAWFDRLIAAGYVDSFRAIRGDIGKQYSFWETRIDARADNIGWRIDYWMVPSSLDDQIRDAWLSPQIRGSDHCPAGLELDVALDLISPDQERHHDEADQFVDREEEQEEEEEDTSPRRRR